MFYQFYVWFFDPEGIFSFFRLFKYISFRALYAAVTAFIISLLVGPTIIRNLKRLKFHSNVWEYDLLNEEHKTGTPTMGGALIMLALLVSTVLWCDLSNPFIQVILIAIVWFSTVGATDDHLKLKFKSKAGLSEKYKLLGQGGFGLILGAYMVSAWSPIPEAARTQVFLPFYKFPVEIGLLYIGLIFVTIMASSNAVNLADGMDGLAIVPAIFVLLVYGAYAYVVGNTVASNYLHFTYLPRTGELVIVCAAFFGAGMGFLWYNCYPAQVFMGDLGSLAIGGVIGVVAVCVKQEFLLIIAGGLFVTEAFTSLIQRYIFVKYLGRRFFFRAPLHHSLRFYGLAEPKVVVRLWIISAILMLIALSALKIR